MTERSLAARIEEALDVDPESFDERVDREAALLTEELADGTFDNPQANIGLEYEFYTVEDDTKTLARVPRRLLDFVGLEKELGLHNAEMCTGPQPLNADGILAQEAEVKARLRTALDCVGAEGLRLVSDGLWTIPPEGESPLEYLTKRVEKDGISIATNMSESVRYHAMGNTEGANAVGMNIDAPHVSLSAETILPTSLITSIQPHYQVANAVDLPEYFRYALRIAGPLLALGVNSPFFPAELYDDAPPEEILGDAWMEHRLHIFEAISSPDGTTGKARFPRDFDSLSDTVDRIAADATIVRMPIEETGRFDDQFATFRHKHGTYWRWVRPVFDGASRSSANARIEFRPIPAQPTVRDSISFQVVFAGLMSALPQRDHPVGDLDWERAHENFYTAMQEGLAGEFHWITAEGTETTDRDELYRDLFEFARRGLVSQGLSEDEAEKYVWPLRWRARHERTPARWKHRFVERELEDGADLKTAIETMQREYISRQSETLLEESFADWTRE